MSKQIILCGFVNSSTSFFGIKITSNSYELLDNQSELRIFMFMRLKPILYFLVIFYLSIFASNIKSKTTVEPVEKKNFIFYFDNPKYIPFADSVLNEARSFLINMLDDSLDYKPFVYLTGDLSEFNELVSEHFPDWGAAAAIPLKKRIVIKSPDKFNLNKSLQQLLMHEYAHLAVYQKSIFQEPPRWINEGIAQYISMEWTWSNNIAMGKASVFGQTIDLDEIELVNRFSEQKAQVAYAESYLAVKFLLKNYGQNAVKVYLEQTNQMHSPEDVIYITTGSTWKEFQADFNKYVHQQFNYVSLFMDTIYLWIALAIIVIYTFFVKYKKRREYYKRWEEDEKLHSTDFDYGDANNPEEIDDDEPWRQ